MAATHSQNFVEHGAGVGRRRRQVVKPRGPLQNVTTAKEVLLPGLLLLLLAGHSSETDVDVGQEGSEPVLPVFAGPLVLLLHSHMPELLLQLVKGISTTVSARIRPAPVVVWVGEAIACPTGRVSVHPSQPGKPWVAMVGETKNVAAVVSPVDHMLAVGSSESIVLLTG